MIRALSEQGIQYEHISHEDKANAAFLLECRTFEDVLADIGLGKRTASLVTQQCFVHQAGLKRKDLCH